MAKPFLAFWTLRPSSWFLVVTLQSLLARRCSCENSTHQIPVPGSIPTDDIMPDYPITGKEYELNVTILVTLTTGGVLPTDLGKSGAAIEMAIREARQTILPNVFIHYDIISRKGMTGCSDEENHATYLVTNYAYEKAGKRGIPPVGLLVGPACTVATQHTGRVAADMDLPLINSQATSDYFDDRTVFKTLTRLAYTMYTLNAFSFKVMDALNYTDVSIIYDEVMPWSQVTGQVFYRAMYYRTGLIKMNPHQFSYKPADKVDYRFLLGEAIKSARVVIVLAVAKVVRQWMLAAFDMGLCNGDYLFVTYEWFRSPYYGEYTWQYYDERDQDARTAYRTLLKIASMEYWESEVFRKWSNEVKMLAKNRFGYVYGPNETVAPSVTGMHDGVLLYATALNETLAAGEDPFNGTIITKRMWGKTIKSPEGLMKVTATGVKDQSFVLQQLDPASGFWKRVMAYDGITGIFNASVDTITWIDGKSLPPNIPKCGFQNENLSCLVQNSDVATTVAAIVAVFVVMIICCITGFRFYQKRKFEQSLLDNWWQINRDDVKKRHEAKASTATLQAGSRPSVKAKSALFSASSQGSNEEAVFYTVGRYQGKMVHIREIHCPIEITRDFLVHMKRLHGLVHENLNQLVGLCTETNHETIYTMYCAKQSLGDLLQNDSISLDWSFKFSLVLDLINGMDYLHASFLRSFGYLTSSNCVIDGRFVLKITDFHFPMLRPPHFDLADLPPGSLFNYKTLLWRAPEHLRSVMPQNGTQEGDVYSAGIILQEVCTRTDPYFDRETSLSYDEVIRRVSVPEDPPYRPQVIVEGLPKEFFQIMQACWRESPEARPTFRTIKSTLKSSKLNKEGNIMDNLLKRMEKYSQDLEQLVAERTKAFFDEKKKAEELLYQVMPREIADVLKVGGYIPPEAFECVSVYFSDIAGFIQLSAESTPFQIVEFLNDVYTLFDGIIENFDAYKVETISDTYMVASGLPVRNGDKHAYEIARMALRFLSEARKYRVPHRPELNLQLRIGINSGPCAAGIVGLKMPRYCLFGDTVNTASRMESSGQALMIHTSQTTKEILDTFKCFHLELRGEIEVKGKGKCTTYWLRGVY